MERLSSASKALIAIFGVSTVAILLFTWRDGQNAPAAGKPAPVAPAAATPAK